ncbi:MAG TPA: sugar transferase [Rhodobacteraceae bacterium]|jgi:lipopolysaccharide/colanic/teichoic acid biosynthesis glycosyltransferase|nr:sugar transferase [Paracoccaceae bacterium]
MTYFSNNGFADVSVSSIPKLGIYRRAVKRVLDVAISIILIPIALLILVPAAFLVSLDGAAPFYWQKRIGRNGRVYSMLKLRSMVPNADAMLNDYLDENPKARREWDELQKLKNDPRITPIGRIIRKTSIDELPQIWNVLTGDMSLVGPRPIMCNQRKLYPGLDYYSMRPGITGYWQISDRNECSFAERALFDAEYHNEMSFGTDIAVLTRTVGVVLRATGH